MFTKKEKKYLQAVLDKVIPSGRNREEVREGLALLDSISEKVKAMETEPGEDDPKDPGEPAPAKPGEYTGPKRPRRRTKNKNK